ISGNCSLYNETNGEGIFPTPAIGAVGLMGDVHRMATIAFKREGEAIMLIGDTRGHLGQSIYLREIEGREQGAAPPVDLAAEKAHGEFVRRLIEQGRVDTCHDLSDGGLLVALSEMALAGDIGCEAGVAGTTVEAIPFFFGEDQARYAIAAPVEEMNRIEQEARDAGIIHAIVGKTHAAKTLRIAGAGEIALADLRAAHEGWFPAYMAKEEVPPVN
ncbi:MAG: phosphoribosylformylglycinamidine synthase II, partial [Alphaproteobacteria bacterium]|nr:phosphoribosylformylglycinamidine synthase II [Alphaproteobacteria bacterium]